MHAQGTMVRACASCGGTGAISSQEVVNCPVCHGSSKFLDRPCLGCGGSGTVELQDEALCPECTVEPAGR